MDPFTALKEVRQDHPERKKRARLREQIERYCRMEDDVRLPADIRRAIRTQRIEPLVSRFEALDRTAPTRDRGRIPQQELDAVAPFLEQYLREAGVELRRRGSHFRMDWCPFKGHRAEKPSGDFNQAVYPDGGFRCWSRCGSHTAHSVVMANDNVSLERAHAILSTLAGVTW